MTTRRPLLAILVAAAATVSAPAPGQSPATVPSGDANALIQSLHSPDWQTRQQAEDALVALGGDASAPIQAALENDSIDFESRERLQSALARIEQERLLIATRVTVQRQFASPREAFAHLAEIVGLRLETESDIVVQRAAVAEGPVSLDLTNAPWLAAVDELTALTGIVAEASDTRLRLLEAPPDSLRPPTDYTGSAAISATGARKRQSLQFGDDNRRTDVYLSLGVELEPKIALVDSSARLVIRKIIADNGQPVRQDQILALSRRGGNRYLANFTLGSAANLPARIASIEGELQGEIITRVEHLRITDLSTLPRTVPFPDGEVEITSLETDDKGSRLVIGVPTFLANRGTGQSIARGQIEGLTITDQAGQPMQLTRATAVQHRAGLIEYRITLTSDTPAAVPTTLTWNTPSQTRDVRIPFKLENLPLPD